MATKRTGKPSLKEQFTSLIEQQILSGELAIGQQLPPERDLAQGTGISRTIVHAGIVELAAKKVLIVIPRKGAFVADYRRSGTLELYNALVKYAGHMDGDIFRSLVEFRDIIEVNNARLAAVNATLEDIAAMRAILLKERAAMTVDEAVELDYEFHIQVAAATGNIILPMSMRSTEKLYKALVREFYTRLYDWEIVHDMHERLIGQIALKQSSEAQITMEELLIHGKSFFEQG